MQSLVVASGHDQLNDNQLNNLLNDDQLWAHGVTASMLIKGRDQQSNSSGESCPSEETLVCLFCLDLD